MRFSLPSIIITTTTNVPWNEKKKQKTSKSTNHSPRTWPFELVNVCFLRRLLRSTAAKNATGDWAVGVRMLLKVAVNSFYWRHFWHLYMGFPIAWPIKTHVNRETTKVIPNIYRVAKVECISYKLELFINNNLNLARKYARIFVRGHSLFREAKHFPRTNLAENCEVRGTDNVQRQTFICVYYPSNVFTQGRSFWEILAKNFKVIMLAFKNVQKC